MELAAEATTPRAQRSTEQEERLERIDDLSGTSNICAEGSTSSELCAENRSLDPQLQLLIERWPTLSKAVQQQIMLLDG